MTVVFNKITQSKTRMPTSIVNYICTNLECIQWKLWHKLALNCFNLKYSNIYQKFSVQKSKLHRMCQNTFWFWNFRNPKKIAGFVNCPPATYRLKQLTSSTADPRERRSGATPPPPAPPTDQSFLISCSFFWENMYVGAPSYGESWIRPWSWQKASRIKWC